MRVAVAGAMLLGLSACPSGDEPDPIGGCFVDNQFHKAGASFPSSDGCNTCSCDVGGSVSCTEIACAPKEKKCVRGGCSSQLCVEEGGDLLSTCEWREEYACFAKANCERQASGACGHTPSPQLDACLAATGSHCTYNGEFYKTGESFPSADKCNTCTCGPAGVACTKKACVPDEPTPKECVRTGCSGQLCAETELISTCEFKPVYACYEKSTCERQKNGQCGFTPTHELVQCLGTHDTCLVDGKAFPVGATMPSADGCNNCFCQSGGWVACTANVCR